MKSFWINVGGLLVVGLSFEAAWSVHPLGWRLLVLWGATIVTQKLYVQRYPRFEALKWGTKLKRGQKVTVEGK